MGMRRKPYIIISMAFMSFNWAMMALAVNGKYGAIFCLLGANLGCAVANVCCEAITVLSFPPIWVLDAVWLLTLTPVVQFGNHVRLNSSRTFFNELFLKLSSIFKPRYLTTKYT